MGLYGILWESDADSKKSMRNLISGVIRRASLQVPPRIIQKISKKFKKMLDKTP